MLLPRSEIIICDDIFLEEQQLLEQLQSSRVVSFVKEKFLIEDAKAVIAEAYISEESYKYIIIGAIEFNIYSQNSLLKILEEPPKNIIFLLLSNSKTILLPTIRSRLPIVNKKTKPTTVTIDIDLKKLNLEAIYNFITTHKDLTKQEAKQVVEALFLNATQDGLKLNEQQLENFQTAYKLLELNTKVSSVFAFLLMGFLYEN